MLLEIKPTASLQEIRTSYRKLALRWHPDRAREPEAPERFRAITEAYETLRAPERRRAYDELRQFRGRTHLGKPKSAARVGRDALNWVEEFFIQAGGIEAEGPGKGSLRRFSQRDLEEIWFFIASHLATRGEVRLSIRQLELVSHYLRKHPELSLPPEGEKRVREKLTVLLELEALRKGIRLGWNVLPPALEDLLRDQKFEDARSLLLWRAAHDAADKLAGSGLFEASPQVRVPSRELAMVDRLESIGQGEQAERKLGHGYVACKRCGAWAMVWGVVTPRCSHCGSRRMALRPRDERDEWLAQLIRRRPPLFWTQANQLRAAVILGLERWVWAPLFTVVTLLAAFVAGAAGAMGLEWLSVLFFAAAWFWGAWAQPDLLPADTDLLFPDEWDVSHAVGGVLRWAAIAGLIITATIGGIGGDFSTAIVGNTAAVLAVIRPNLYALFSPRA